MSGAAMTTRPKARTHRAAGWIWIVVALLVVAPVRGWDVDHVDASNPRPADRAHAGDAPAWSTADLASTKPDTTDRRHTPGGSLPGVVVLVLGALVLGFVARARTTAPGKPRVAFRRRGPPLLQLVR